LWKAIDLWGGESNGRDWSGEFFTLYGDLETAAEEKRLETRDARIPSTTPSVTLEAYVGTYIDEVYDRLTVSLQGGDLHLRLGPEISGRLTHWHHDTFLLTFDRAWQRETLVGFALDSAGVPSRVEFFDQSFDRLQDTDLTTHQVPGTH
jgi:hypothetical protein